MIIFEGPDGAGKTTLIEAFQEAYNIPIAPRVVTKGAEAMIDLKQWVDNELRKGFQYKIFDRYRLISEPIYGPILRNKSEPGFNDIQWLTSRMHAFYDLDPVIIYCLPPLETVRANIMGDPDNVVVESRIDAIYSAYVNKAAIDINFSPGLTIVWDYTDKRSIVDNLPIWFDTLHTRILERLQSEN